MKQMLVLFLAVFAIACGSDKRGANPGPDGGDEPDGPAPDAPLPAGCTGPIAANPQCSNCLDDDGDGAIDGFDVECTGATDNDEGSFKTGIPGDNIDSKNQDCFFDGNSGAGDDGCNIQTCCLLGITDKAQCPTALGGNNYNPDNCPPPIGTKVLAQNCIDSCAPLSPPGCDCFGCCTVCNPDNPGECFDILTNPAVSPDCTVDVLADPAKCLRCTQSDECNGGSCGGGTCVLCPGQDPNDLPAGCNGMTSCPDGVLSCQTDPCPSGSYCDNNCCVSIPL